MSERVANYDSSDQIFIDKLKKVVTGLYDRNNLFQAEIDVLTVKKDIFIKRDNAYPMTKNPRGYCVIIDNEKFSTMTRRIGTTADTNRLAYVFIQLFFRVIIYRNKTAEEMLKILSDIATDNALIGHNALAVIILSHGSTEGIYGTDGVTVPQNKIFKMFNNKNCPQLIFKPKMFFLNACRGGHVSMRDIFKGSWFGQELANCLAESAHRAHLNNIMTIHVAKRVSDRTAYFGEKLIKQAVHSHSQGSLKKLYFNPGFYA
ncbi:unnamed protein product [Medioppia subpectinata]|uniref:Uncharacterized protein n=1 Tax=Medioppia subpectinata TaxID=1979941 RepID=A0A7R9KSW3_9ACAR|nr:unnamed protein product [Medioppia subpectinata]CAG2108821.1 unnamed protein product [Medioppia subpectinata]